ncbi:MAG: GIY-YIG nuclease family protein, partial [Dehalococcoidia bacterium]|nr:GIY-YIG nuclease family protein [Dehalococcoidia bacterium]
MTRWAFIYVLVDPADDIPMYVGKTMRPGMRQRRHVTERGQRPIHRWVAALLAEGKEPELIIVERIDVAEWADRERAWVRHLRATGHASLNVACGGNGAPGVIPSPETRAKLRAATLATWHRAPRTMTPEHLAAWREGSRLAVRTPEWRAKIAASHRGKRLSPETRVRISVNRRGKGRGPRSASLREKLRVQKLGERNPQAKLTYPKAEEIRARYAAGGVSL